MTDRVQVSSGVLLVDKPTGMTSHTVVSKVRGRLLEAFPHWNPRSGTGRPPRGGPRPPRFKCGHAGTLDPLATGLLLILVGKGSRLSPFLMGLDKTYQATVRFGAATDTLDADGEVVAEAPLPAGPQSVIDVLDEFRGDIQQVPPAVSALKHEGTPLYKLVRQGKPLPELKARPVHISRLEVETVRWEVGEVDLVVSCSSGTYIRSLARDIAQAAGSEGHLTALRRQDVGPFQVGDALTGIQDRGGEEMAAKMLSLAEALQDRPTLELDPERAAFLRQGGQPDDTWQELDWKSSFQDPDAGSILRMIDHRGDLVAVGRHEGDSDSLRCVTVIPAESKESGT